MNKHKRVHISQRDELRRDHCLAKRSRSRQYAGLKYCHGIYRRLLLWPQDTEEGCPQRRPTKAFVFQDRFNLQVG